MSAEEDKLSQEFLDKCVASGRITQEECDAVAVGRESSGCCKPEWKGWCGIRPRLWTNPPVELTLQDCEIYINYPAWTMGEIAEQLGLTVGEIRISLDRTRRLLPSLQRDPRNRQGLPNLAHMVSLDKPGMPEPSLGDNDIIF